jgi:secondary thiamine-phosphate synthase enzyme
MSHRTFKVESDVRTGFFDITDRVRSVIASEGVKEGVCTVFVPHTTAGVTINESADPAVQNDMITELNRIVPFDDGYTHTEGNSAAHIKASLVGSSVSIPISGGRLTLGTWQGVFFCEFDGPRQRNVHCALVGI